MENNVVQTLFNMNLALTFTLFLVFITRKPIGFLFGLENRYRVWGCTIPGLVFSATFAHTLPLSQTPSTIAVGRTIETVHGLIAKTGPEFSTYVFWCWLAGAVLCLLGVWGAHMRFVGSLGKLIKHKTFWQAEHVQAGPAVIGIFPMKIVLPKDFSTRYTDEEQALIYAHENVHAQRGDTLINAVVAIAQALFWFNPLVHIGARLLRFDQELACDARVMEQHPKARHSYAQAMLKTELLNSGTLIGCHWLSHHPLKERIMNLSRPTCSYLRDRFGALCVIGLIGLASGGSWTLCHAAEQIIPGAAVGRSFHATIDVKIDGAAPSSAQLLLRENEPATLAFGEGKHAWEWIVMIKASDTNSYRMESQLIHAGTKLAKPALLAQYDKPAHIKVNDADKKANFEADIKVETPKT